MSVSLPDIPIGILLDNPESLNFKHLLVSGKYNCAFIQVTNKNFRKKCLKAQHDFEHIVNSDCHVADTSSINVHCKFNSKVDTCTNKKTIERLIAPYPNYNDSILPSISHKGFVVGILSPWINLESLGTIGLYHFQILYNEVAFAQFLGVKSFILPINPNVKKIQLLSSAINKLLHTFPSIKVSLYFQYEDDNLEFPESSKCFQIWNVIKIQCENSQNLSLALCNTYSNAIDIWISEPVRFFLLPIIDAHVSSYKEKLRERIITIAQLNTLNPPVFAIKTSTVDENSLEQDAKIESSRQTLKSILKDVNHKTMVSPLFLSAVHNVLNTNIPPNIIFSSNLLQMPMKPFSENLEDAMYNEFEKDTHKYDQYERAFMKALIDLTRVKKPNEIKHVLFLGPGRGPLIDRFFAALKTLSIPPSNFNITALERNHSLISILSEKNRTLWNESVKVLCMDSSSYPQSKHNLLFGKVHLVVSELMGSFGCNELMPECIDSIAIPEVCSSDCIFIPYSIESYLAPISAPLLWKIASQNNIQYPMEQIYIPLVPFMKRHGVSPTWKFESHVKVKERFPEDSVLDLDLLNYYNSRQSTSSFLFSHSATIEGLAGYFIATLYPGFEPITISNFDPPSGERGCISWLPAFFPFTEPIYLNEKCTLEVTITRNCMGNKVWYEWSALVTNQCSKEEIISTLATKVHNVNGRGFQFSR